MDETSAAQAAIKIDSVGEPNQFQQGLVEWYHGILNGNVAEASATFIMKVVLPAGIALLAIIVAYFVAKLVARWVTTASTNRIDQTLGKFAGKLTFYVLFASACLAVLDKVGISVTAFAAVIAAASFAIGLAFQGTLSSFASGILLLVFRPFKVGDMVNAAGVTGKVNEIDLFTTTLDTVDNRRLIIPNSSIAGTTIENITYHKHRRIDIPVGVAYSADLDETRRVLAICAESIGKQIIQGEGRGYQVLLTNLGSHSVEWTIRVWAETKDFFSVKETLTAEIKRQLDLHGLEIPFPQMQLHFKENEPGLAKSALSHQVLPMPKMNPSSVEVSHSSRVRPRVRGA